MQMKESKKNEKRSTATPQGIEIRASEDPRAFLSTWAARSGRIWRKSWNFQISWKSNLRPSNGMIPMPWIQICQRETPTKPIYISYHNVPICTTENLRNGRGHSKEITDNEQNEVDHAIRRQKSCRKQPGICLELNFSIIKIINNYIWRPFFFVEPLVFAKRLPEGECFAPCKWKNGRNRRSATPRRRKALNSRQRGPTSIFEHVGGQERPHLKWPRPPKRNHRQRTKLILPFDSP